MNVRFPTYAPFVLYLSLAASLVTGCNRNVASPTSPTEAGGGQSAITADPLNVEPELLHPSTCPGEPTFGFRVNVIVGHRRDLVLRGLQFRLVDLLGATTLPEVIPLSASSAVPVPSNLPGSVLGAATLPASPIPIPGGSPMHGVFIEAGGSRGLPFYLRFGCGRKPAGTLFISADAADMQGRPYSWDARVRVGR